MKKTAIKSFVELYSALHPNGQGSGSIEGWVKFQGRNFWICKHWSSEHYCCYDFEPYYDENNIYIFPPMVGILEIIKDTARPWIIDGVPQLRHGIWQLYDFDLQFIEKSNED